MTTDNSVAIAISQKDNAVYPVRAISDDARAYWGQEMVRFELKCAFWKRWMWVEFATMIVALAGSHNDLLPSSGPQLIFVVTMIPSAIAYFLNWLCWRSADAHR